MRHRLMPCVFAATFVLTLVSSARSEQMNYENHGDSSSWGYDWEEGGAGSPYLGVDIADVSPERLGELKLKEEHGAEITMVDQDAPAGKAGIHEHDVIVSLNGTAVESAAQLRRMIKETPAGRVINLGISRDGQPLNIKVQLADRRKLKEWEPNVHLEMPRMPDIPPMPDFDMPVSVVVVHSSARSGLLVENITPQLGDFFGVKDGKGVLIRSVEKGSHGEKSGFRAGDVVVRVDNQPVHDTSDFTRALRSASRPTIGVTVMRDKREQNLTLTLPEKKDSGKMMEDSLDVSNLTAEIEEAVNLTGIETANLASAGQEMQETLRDREQALRERQRALQEQRQEMRDRQREILQERQEQMENALEPHPLL